MICKHCQYERRIDDPSSGPAGLVCPSCAMPYQNKSTDPEVMARLKKELASVKGGNKNDKGRLSFAVPGKALWFVAQAVAVGIGVLLAVRCSSSVDDRAFTWNDALLMCQQAIARTALDPDKAEVPYVPNAGSDNNYYFAWGASTHHARMRNGFGLDVPVSASCLVDGNARTITQLTVDGKAIK